MKYLVFQPVGMNLHFTAASSDNEKFYEEAER